MDCLIMKIDCHVQNTSLNYILFFTLGMYKYEIVKIQSDRFQERKTFITNPVERRYTTNFQHIQ